MNPNEVRIKKCEDSKCMFTHSQKQSDCKQANQGSNQLNMKIGTSCGERRDIQCAVQNQAGGCGGSAALQVTWGVCGSSTGSISSAIGAPCCPNNAGASGLFF